MSVCETYVRCVVFEGVKDLDPITVFIQNFGYRELRKSNAGRITFCCFKNAWTVCFEAIGDKTVEQFFVEAAKEDPDYILRRSTPDFVKAYKKYEKEYILRIIKTIASGLERCTGNMTTPSSK